MAFLLMETVTELGIRVTSFTLYSLCIIKTKCPPQYCDGHFFVYQLLLKKSYLNICSQEIYLLGIMSIITVRL